MQHRFFQELSSSYLAMETWREGSPEEETAILNKPAAFMNPCSKMNIKKKKKIKPKKALALWIRTSIPSLSLIPIFLYLSAQDRAQGILVHFAMSYSMKTSYTSNCNVLPLHPLPQERSRTSQQS